MTIRYYVGTKKDLENEFKAIPYNWRLPTNQILILLSMSLAEVAQEYGSLDEMYRVHGKRYVQKIRV